MKIEFTSYYKYMFYFHAEDGSNWECGGNPDDVYRLTIHPQMFMKKDEDGIWFIDGLIATKI